MSLRHAVRAALLGALSITLVGCSSNRPYPVTWPTVLAKTGDSCDGLAGDYQDTGEGGGGALEPGARWPRLTELLFWHEEEIATNAEAWNADQVTLSFLSNGELQVIASRDRSELFTRRLDIRSAQAACNAGTLNLRHVRWRKYPPYLGLVESAKFSVTLDVSAVDHYLVVQTHAKVFRLMGVMVPVVPWWSAESEWYRFERLVGESEPRFSSSRLR